MLLIKAYLQNFLLSNKFQIIPLNNYMKDSEESVCLVNKLC